ncbi:aldehyde dehydrogenase family protein [Glutamicibacter sp. NPDC087344]|uniref:aldehyde dehydrogenase family protein n=1 Tax=Glutamicibacter sp. NPDC087344 TaxID=3363994 RepID=UPI003815EDF4
MSTQTTDTHSPSGSDSPELIDIRNEATGAVVGSVRAGTAQDVQHATKRGRAGAQQWAQVPAHRRSEILLKFVELARSQSDELAVLLAAESGKILAHSRNELETALRIFTGYAEETKRLFGEAIPLDVQPGLEGDLLVTRREPLGVVAAVLAFNFPVELYAQKVGAALAGGNAVIVKPPEDDSLTCVRLTELLHQAGVPEDSLQVLTGYGAQVGAPLTSSTLIDAISFTGSSAVGTTIAETAARNGIRAFLELSGNDAFIVCEDADVDLAVSHAVMGRLYGNGQVCVATKRIMVAEAVYEKFLAKLLKEVGGKKLGDPTDPDTEIGPLINERAARKVEAQVQQAISEGAVLRLGGTRDGAFFEPTVLEINTQVGIATDDEIFGPVFSVLKFATVQDAVKLANDSAYGLGGAVFSRDFTQAFAVAAAMQTGMVSINGGNCYRPDLSAFGGYKKSGIGREGFHYTLEEMTQLKSIVMRGILPIG